MNAYSEVLRKKIVEALGRGATKSEAARTFGVSRSSVKRYAKRADEGRTLAPKKRPGLKPKLDEAARKLLEEDLEERPKARGDPAPAARVPASGGRSLAQRVDREQGARAPWMEPKKRSMAAGERDEFMRAAWRALVTEEIDAERIVFVDEMGSNTSLRPL